MSGRLLLKEDVHLQHTVSVRVPLDTFNWILAQSNQRRISVSRFINLRMAELAQQDLARVRANDNLSVGVGE